MEYTIEKQVRVEPHGKYIYSYRGKSSYTKPTAEDIATGSDLYDLDTGKAYMYDGDTQTWIEQ